MKLVAQKDLKQNVYKVKLSVIDITDTDRERISDFGELVINVGGVITGQDKEEKYVPVQEPVTDTQTVPLFEEDGVTPIYEEDGITQKTEEIEVPVLDGEGKPVTRDKVDGEGNIIYQLVEEDVEVVLADLGKVLRKFPSEFPVTRDFSVAEYGEIAEELALAYIQLVKDELTEKLSALEGKVDSFTGVEEYNLINRG